MPPIPGHPPMFMPAAPRVAGAPAGAPMLPRPSAFGRRPPGSVSKGFAGGGSAADAWLDAVDRSPGVQSRRAPAGWQGLGDQSRTAAYDPTWDYSYDHPSVVQSMMDPTGRLLPGSNVQGNSPAVVDDYRGSRGQPATRLASSAKIADIISRAIGMPQEAPPVTAASYPGAFSQPPAQPPQDTYPQAVASPPAAPSLPTLPFDYPGSSAARNPLSPAETARASAPSNSYMPRMPSLHEMISLMLGGGSEQRRAVGEGARAMMPHGPYGGHQLGGERHGGERHGGGTYGGHTYGGLQTSAENPVPPGGLGPELRENRMGFNLPWKTRSQNVYTVGGGGDRPGFKVGGTIGDILGSLVGAYFGGPAGLGIGGFAGSALGNLLPFAEGGRLPMMRGGYPELYNAPVRHAFAHGGGDEGYVPSDGRGNGRSDHIAADLSPGEFVMDAETTSLLGDGDNEAGAREFENLRQNIRKHKGRQLAEGKFSPKAKSPEAYMSSKMSASDLMARSGRGNR